MPMNNKPNMIRGCSPSCPFNEYVSNIDKINMKQRKERHDLMKKLVERFVDGEFPQDTYTIINSLLSACDVFHDINILSGRVAIQDIEIAVLKKTVSSNVIAQRFLRTKVTKLEVKITEQDAKITEQDAKITEQDAKITEQDAKITEQDCFIHKRTIP